MKEKWLNSLGWMFLTYILLNIEVGILRLIFGENPSTLVIVLWTIIGIISTTIMWLIYHHKIFVHTIKIKLFDNSTLRLFPTRKGDLIDLHAAEDIEMKAFEYKLIPLGVAMKLPIGYKANLYSRSSTYKNFGIILANGVGQVDSDYCGSGDQWYYPAIALRDTVIHKGDRICQFEIVPVMNPVNFKVVEELEDKDRGGIGSTGIK